MSMVYFSFLFWGVLVSCSPKEFYNFVHKDHAHILLCLFLSIINFIAITNDIFLKHNLLFIAVV